MGRKFRQWSAALACGFGTFLAGGAYTWITPLMLKFVQPQSPVPMSKADTSWLAASMKISATVCTVPVGILCNKWGRKYLLISIGPLCLVSWLLILTTRSVEALYAARIVHGLALGLALVVGPIYVAEIAEPKDRGKVCGTLEPIYFAGCVYSAVMGPFVSYNCFAVVHLVPAVVFIFAMAAMPESPYFLVISGKQQKGFEALMWLRNGDILDIRNEFESITLSVNEDKKNKGFFKDLFRSSDDIKRFTLVQAVCIVKYLCGTTAISVYITQTFNEELPGLFTSEFYTIVFMVCLVAASSASSIISDYIGRRPLLLVSTAGSGVCSVFVGILFFMTTDTSVDSRQFIWFAFVGTVGLAVLSNVGIGPLAETIQAEYFPSRTRAIGGGVTQMVAAVAASVSIKQYQLASDLAGVYLNYWIFAAVSLAGLAFFYFFIPETKGQSLDQIQICFSHNA